MADLTNKTASIYINHAAAEEALKKLQAQADKLTESIKKGQDAGKDMVTQLNKLNDVKNQMASVQRQIDQGLKPSFNQLQTLVAKTTAELKKMSQSDPGFTAKAKQLNQYSTELSKLGKQISTIQGGGLRDVFKEMLAPLAELGTGAAIIGFLKSAVDEGLQAEKATAQFKNTLDKAGRSDAFERLANSAEDMAARFKFLDSNDITNVFNRLLSYGKLTEAQIKELTPIIINFAAKSKVSLDDAATTIINALAGSGRELEQYGIKISKAQTESERLSLIMTDLAAKVNGAADAFRETTQGNIAETEQSIKNLKEEIGTGLLPVLKKGLTIVNDFIKALRFGFSGIQSTTNANSLADFATKMAEDYAKNNFSGKGPEAIAQEMGTHPILEQKITADYYKKIYIDAQDALAKFLNSSDKSNKDELKKLMDQQNEAERVYLATQRTLQDSINTEKENQAQKDTEDAKKKAQEAERRRQEELKKYQAYLDKLKKMWDDLRERINNTPLGLSNDPEYQAFKKANDQAKKDTDEAKLLLDKRIIDYQEYSDAIVKIEQIRHQKVSDIAAKYRNANTDIAYTPSLVPPLNTTAPISTALPNQKDITAGQKKLAADEEERQKKLKAEQEYQKQQAEMIVSSAVNLMSSLDAIQQQHDQERLAANQAAYDEDKNLLDRQLAQKILSQKEYNREVAKLDEKKRKEDAKIKKKEFEAAKREQIVQAIMSGAQAVVSTLAARPGALDVASLGAARLIEIALITATTAAQVATIASQKRPEFAKGGLIDGPSHAQGGMAVVKNGKKVAEIEGGEPILSRATYKNNRELVNQLLYSSMYGNGQRITPYWQSRDYMPVNFSALSRSIETVRHFASGGILPGGGVTSSSADLSPAFFEVFNNMQTTIVRLDSTVTNLEKRMSEPFKSYVVITEANAANEVLARIKSDTTIK